MIDWIIADLDEYLENKRKAECASEEQWAILKAEAYDFLNDVVVVALQNLREPLEKHGRNVQIFGSPQNDSISIQVSYAEIREIEYSVKVHLRPGQAHPYAVMKVREDGQYFQRESFLGRGADDSIYDVSEEDVMKSFLTLYKRQTECTRVNAFSRE